MTHYDDLAPARERPYVREEDHGGNTALWALGLGALAGAAGYALYSQSRHMPDRPGDSAPGRTARQTRFGRYAVVGKTVTIDRPKDEIYAFWRDFTNLARFMENVQAVEQTGGVSRWSILGPAGRTISVETRIVADRPGEEIAWRSTENSQIDTEGKVMFRTAPGNRGAQVEAIVAYHPPAGELGRWIAWLFQKEPEIQGRRELKRLKMLMETGEIATSQMRRTAA